MAPLSKVLPCMHFDDNKIQGPGACLLGYRNLRGYNIFQVGVPRNTQRCLTGRLKLPVKVKTTAPAGTAEMLSSIPTLGGFPVVVCFKPKQFEQQTSLTTVQIYVHATY